jgi:MerR family transcriptional regulator, redox-sensitive transcriptional activator SoxR
MIGEVAAKAGIRTSALRYYEELGLLSPAERVNGRRRYGADVFDRLAVIGLAKEAGFELDEIARLLQAGGGRQGARLWRELAEAKLAEVEAVIARAEAMRNVLRRGLECGCLELSDCARLAAEIEARVAA